MVGECRAVQVGVWTGRCGVAVMDIVDDGGRVVVVGGWGWAVQVGIVEIGDGGWHVVRWRGMACVGLMSGSGFAVWDGVAG